MVAPDQIKKEGKIGQQEVLKCLEKHKKPMSGKEIAEALDQCDKKVYFIISKLLKYGEIFAKEIPTEIAWKEYGSKRRMCLYSYKEEWFE